MGRKPKLTPELQKKVVDAVAAERRCWAVIHGAAEAGDIQAQAWLDGLGTIVVGPSDSAFVRWEDLDQRTERRAAEWRTLVFARDGYCCRHCGATGHLQAHHIDHWASTPSRRFILDNGLTLCVDCHATEHPGKPVVRFGRVYGQKK